MSAEPWDQLPVYRRIEYELKRYIARHKLKRHDRLPSESQLAAEYGASIGTVRKALNDLEAEKVIYRRHGQGTFVAPRSRRSRILLVSNQERIYDVFHPDFMNFFLGLLSHANLANLAYEPQIVELEDFLANLEDVSMVYPESAGVIFFRGYSNVLRPAADTLLARNMPFMYYGGNFYPEINSLCSTVCHNEEAIAEMMADYYVKRGFRKAAGIVNSDLVTQERSRRFAAALARRDMEYREFSEEEELSPIARGFPVFNCFVDFLAVKIIQRLERDCGIRVPDQVAVSGVDNQMFGDWLRPPLTTIDLCHRANGALVMQTFCDFLDGSRRRPFHLDAKLSLLPRESC